ncbi:MAG: peptidase [Prevotella sp.]|nr:peptidase [Prevotella sp.]
MKTKKSIVYIVLFVCMAPLALLQGCLNRDYIDWSDYQTYYMSELPVEPQDFKADFEEIYQKTLNRFAYIEAKHLDMDSIHDAFVSRLDTIQRKTDYALLLREFFASLKAGHAGISFHPYHIGNDAILIENRVFISNPSQAAQKAGFMDKDEILSVNHVPTAEWLQNHSKYISASTEASRLVNTVLEITYDHVDSVRIFGIRRGEEEMELTVNLLNSQQRSGKVWHQLTHKQLTPEVGYIAINMLDEDSVVSSFTKALEEYRNLPYLIVDVRENGGGNSRNGDRIAEYLIKHDCKNWMGEQLTMNKNCFKGQVYVLMGPNSFSAAETFLVELKESGDVVLVGEPSAGDMGGVILPYKTSHGVCFRLPVMNHITTPGGHPTEGKAIQPHRVVHQTIKDFMDGKDTQIEYVLWLIKVAKAHELM